MAGPFTYPVAEALPFDGSSAVPAMVSENAQDGIIEARDNAEGTAAGYVIGCGKSSNVSNGFLEFFDSLASDQNPFVFNIGNKLTGFSVSTKTSSTCTYVIYRDGIAVYTLSQTGTTASISGLDISMPTGSEMSVKVDTGTSIRPLFNIFSKVG
jgi:hypothetical protein